METILLMFLIGLICFQQIFWSIHTQHLVNKLMCRNYFEYKQAEQAFTPKPVKLEPSEPEEDMGVLDGYGSNI